jgi:glutamate synthase (NADPH/NADH) large chain
MTTESPGPFGLYHPDFEHDACGVNFIVDMKGRRSHDIVRMGIGALCNMEHRGAQGAEVNTGDGAGLLMQVPDSFLRQVVAFELPAAGAYATGIAFLPRSPEHADEVAALVGKVAASEGLEVLGWREVPHDPSMIGASAMATLPSFRQVFLAGDGLEGIALERRVYVARKRMEHEIGPLHATGGVYFPSLSGRTLVYKGMLTTNQLAPFFTDLTDERVTSALALVHSRFSTNTFPSWPLAHPFRFVAHNGEINTVAGNRNWMRAREALMAAPELSDDLERIFPICTPGASDSATFDEALEILHLGGYDLPHAVLMMIPEAWENHADMDPDRRAFYQYNSSLMEPWDGPASIAFTDGTVMGAVLDRNGLRPSRYWVTDDDLVIMASEVGVLDVPPHKVVHKGRLQPGRMFLVDTSAGRIIDDAEIKGALASEHPYQQWLDEQLVPLSRLVDADPNGLAAAATRRAEGDIDLLTAQQTFGYTTEELKLIVEPMGRTGAEEIGSMGTDTPLAVLSDRSRLLFDYFIQLFAQVTNPPLDAIREELVTALGRTLGPEGNVLDPTAGSCHQLLVNRPVLTDDELAAIVGIDNAVPGWSTRVLPCLYPVAEGGPGLARAIEDLRRAASAAIAEGVTFIVLSDRHSSAELAPIPSLLATAAVHHHLIAEKTRTRVGLVVETGDAREVHHFCLLVGYGAGAVNPYLALETTEDLALRRAGHEGTEHVAGKAAANYVKAASKGILKVMSKMGISTVASYTGAQIFEAVGLGDDLVDEYFRGTVSRLGGIGVDEVATEVAIRHRRAHLPNEAEIAHRPLEVGGEYQWRREGEYHLFNPTTVFKLQHATRDKRFDVFREYTEAVNNQSEQLATLRGLLRLRTGERSPIPVDEVESVADICKRFSTGAMSYGSISAEAHETLAIAMNRIGGKSNTGEGGEDPERFEVMSNGDSKRSAIKQVASGRFGVTSHYLTNADDLQIKMAQGAKPGEGGQLPGHKVYPWIAQTRHSTPGVGLISPPPHHDIYSIEDLAQLIHDLKCSNPSARVHVKLVAEVGVGTVAAGVSKAHADVVLISGNDGGTGASPLTSLKHAGGPWELGLAETQQTLLANGLRDRIVVQVDGQMKTGRDVVIAALLGAEEFGFATAPLVVSGCVMMRVCHLDTCPVGVATQNPVLRERFSGKPEFVETFFEYIATEVRELLAELGLRSIAEAVGQVELLDSERAVDHWKAAGLDLSPILALPPLPDGAARLCTTTQDHGLEHKLDVELIAEAAPALDEGQPVVLDHTVRNINRTVGTMLGHEVSKRYGGEGLPDDTISINLTGSAGQSLGAFMPRGMTIRLTGDANDYLGKGLSGGRIIVAPHPDAPFVAEENIIAGNVILYGATSGEVYLRGMVGERFGVRNSGAVAVVEGVGDHGCEYMTGGRVVVLGTTGRNFGAGMSGGVAFVYDIDGRFAERVNPEMVNLEALADEDRQWLSDRVRRHVDETGSAVGERILAGGDAELNRFVKVMPRDYARVLAAEAKALADGTDPVEAVMAAARV